MPQRVFRTASGVEWHVWSVIPGNAAGEERRHGYDRRSPDPVIQYKGADRRTSAERRRVAAAPGLHLGWLVFESGAERRRLAPIPLAWEARPECELERLCERAVPVAKGGPPGGTEV
ncbi:MAG TPA: hypothetical protein VGO40_06430 [Longimicrobium sp.]|jgi:hypothetical protein|nr:hypothetical protein [Longimicrobium sp.]